MGLAPRVPAREDGSCALASAEEQARRRVDLHAAHIAPLTVFVKTLRVEQRLGDEVPYIDPHDGGTHARALFLLEAPGPKAVRSGFISRDNPDPSARNFRALLTGAGIEREQTLLWNIVPWYIGTDTKIRAAERSDIRDGAAYLPHLLALLPELQAVVLVGRKAQKAQATIAQLTSARIFETLHPSNQVVTCWPEKRKQVEHDLRAMEPYWALAEELGIPVAIHMGEGTVGTAYIGLPGLSEYRVRLGNPLLLEEVLIRHPRLRVLVMHYGSPQGDWPEVIELAIQIIQEAPFLSEEQKRDIFYNNAARFLQLSEEVIAQHHGKQAGPRNAAHTPVAPDSPLARR